MIYNKKLTLKLTLNSLLVKNQNGNRDWGKIVPSSHNRSEIRSSVGSGFTFQTIVQQNKSIILSSFFKFIPQIVVVKIHLDLHTHDTHL